MNTFTTCRRLVATAALLGYLGLGAVQPASATATINQYDYWASVVDTDDDGDRICGVRTHMENGAELRLMVINGGVHLVAHDPAWHMRADTTANVTISVDDETYTGKAQAIDGQTLLVANLTMDFLQQFIVGDQMLANFGGVHWTVSLIGSSRATNDMGSCIAAARRGLMS